jgi:hypothetical protein
MVHFYAKGGSMTFRSFVLVFLLAVTGLFAADALLDRTSSTASPSGRQ